MNFARSPILRLTAWYVLIIMVISIMFSTIIYRLTLNQVRNSLPGRDRFTTQFGQQFGLPIDQRWVEIFEERYQDVVTRLRLELLALNAFVLVGASVTSYFLAKRTLRPIEQSLEDQRHFTADASHELRTPLAAMKAEIEVALKGQAAGEHRRVLSSNLEEIQKLERLAGSLLHLARHDVDEAAVALEPVELAVVVTEAVERVQPMAKQKRQKIIHDHVASRVYGDQTKLTELLVILLDNAIKYSHDEGVIVVTTQTNNKYVTIKVVDQGVGIAADDVPHIFNRFYRADSSRTGSGADGYGLGLAIAKRIVELHRGSIFATSELGQGTTVSVMLPKA